MRVVRLQKTPRSFPKRKDSLIPPPPARAPVRMQDAGREVSATDDSSSDPEGAGEETVLHVSTKQERLAYDHQSMIRKQKSSFVEEFDKGNPSQLQVDENVRSSGSGRHTMQRENREALTDPDDINESRLVSLSYPVNFPTIPH